MKLSFPCAKQPALLLGLYSNCVPSTTFPHLLFTYIHSQTLCFIHPCIGLSKPELNSCETGELMFQSGEMTY